MSVPQNIENVLDGCGMENSVKSVLTQDLLLDKKIGAPLSDTPILFQRLSRKYNLLKCIEEYPQLHEPLDGLPTIMPKPMKKIPWG
jgi:hypothetical protein